MYMFNGLASATGDGTLVTLTYDTTIRLTGVTYSAGTFTVPKTGRYLITFDCGFDGLSALDTSASILIVAGSNTFGKQFTPTPSANNRSGHHMSIVAALSATNTVVFQASVSGSTKSVNISGQNSSIAYNIVSITLLAA